jgi:hypothetical protein
VRRLTLGLAGAAFGVGLHHRDTRAASPGSRRPFFYCSVSDPSTGRARQIFSLTTIKSRLSCQNSYGFVAHPSALDG